MTGLGQTPTVIHGGARTSGLLVPIITAALVLALGCLLVSLVGGLSSADEATAQPATTNRSYW
jgi:hypothetical protein